MDKISLGSFSGHVTNVSLIPSRIMRNRIKNKQRNCGEIEIFSHFSIGEGPFQVFSVFFQPIFDFIKNILQMPTGKF